MTAGITYGSMTTPLVKQNVTFKNNLKDDIYLFLFMQMPLSVTYTIYFDFKREIISLLINQSTL